MHCSHCQTPLPAHAAFCPGCGVALAAVTGPTQRLRTAPPTNLRSGVCPHCHSHTVYADSDIPEYVKRSVDGANVMLISGGILPNTATLTHYVCTTCGYAETFLLSAEDRHEIERRWTQVQPRP